MSFLKLDNINKSYGTVEVLRDINIAIEEGEFLVLVGPSGCGKSTLLNIIAGLETITTGDIQIKDRSLAQVHPSKRNIAMVFQSYALYPNMTVEQNITFGLEMHGVPQEQRDAKMQAVAKMLKIEQLLSRKPSQLSGGQRQRVAMGRALVRDPDVFLFDEPLSNLDAKLRVEMRLEIKRLHHQLRRTVVYVTHDQIEAMTLSTRIAVMNGGIVQQLGTPKEIYDQPANIFVADFMGNPSMNLLPAKIVAVADQLKAELTNDAGEAIQLQMPSSVNLNNYVAKQVILGIHPESITDLQTSVSHPGIVEKVTNTIGVVEPTGSDTFVTSSFGNTECTARLQADTQINSGDKFEFAFNMDKVVAFDPQTENRIT